jgi:flavin-binding protein dodecin
MSIVKVIEVISEGNTIDEALKAGVTEAAKTVENITQINVVHIEGIVENQKVKKFRINSKISFVVHHPKG